MFLLLKWDWVESEVPNFKSLQGDGGLLVAPILQLLILNRDPKKVIEFVDNVCKWNFRRVIPCHLANNISCGPKDFRDAFSFLEEKKKPLPFPLSLFQSQKKLPAADVRDCKLLIDASKSLTEQGVLYEAAPLLPR